MNAFIRVAAISALHSITPISAAEAQTTAADAVTGLWTFQMIIPALKR